MLLENPRILLIDDHVLFLEGLARLLGSLSSEVITSNSAEESLSQLSSLAPDLILIDLSMPGMDGLSFIQAVEARGLLIPIVVISATEDLSEIRRVIDAGAFGFVPKSIDRDGLFMAIEAVLSGNVYVTPSILSRLPLRSKQTDVKSDHGLSTRQIEILRLLSRGYSNKKISLILFISDQTVKTHLRNIFQILAVSSRTEAVAKILELDLL